MTDRLPTEKTLPADARQLWLLAGAALLVTAMAGLVVIQYCAPTKFHAFWGEFNHDGIRQFQRSLLIPDLPRMSPSGFTLWFRIFLIAAWAGYAVMLAAGIRGAAISPKRGLALVAGIAVLMAVLCPPSLSIDAYGYLAHARLQTTHGLNPYFHKVGELRALADPVFKFTRWDDVSPYGPFWTMITCGVVALLRSAGLWWQVACIKLITAVALVVAALAGRRIADHFSPGRGSLTLLAIGLNPLFLIEGPGNGHNDLVMMSLLMMGIVFYLRRNYALAAVLVGFSAATKLITALVIPWVCAERLWLKGRRTALQAAVVIGLLALLPLILTYAPFWHGPATLAGVTTLPTLSSDVTAGNPSMGKGSAPEESAGMGRFAAKQWPLIAVFAILSIWLLDSKKPGRWLTAWIAMSGYMALFAMGLQFPWYLIWPWTVALTRWDRPHVLVSMACFVLGLVSVMMYSVTV